jgi:transcriptional regulator GlxA family with amidase domain
MLDQPGGTHTVETLADQVNMSRSVFAKRFKKAFGRGPIDLLRNIRLNRASQLLMQSDHPVKRIAELVGYRSRATFTRVFYAEFGVSPDRFRRKS